MIRKIHWQWVAVGIILLVNLPQLLGDFTIRNWDSQGHIFQASHYLTGWFSPWDGKWYSGFWVFGYPPLIHQLIALSSYLFGTEGAYRFIQLVFLLAFPLAVWLLGKEILSEKAAEIAALLSTGLSGTYVVLYTFGQLPSFASLIFALMAVAFLLKYLKTGKILMLLGWFSLTGCSVAAHHHTLIFTACLSAVATLSCWLIRWDRGQLKRTVIAVTVFALAVGLTILPFWWWYFTKQVTQASIWHPTRGNIFSSDLFARMFFWDMYGGMLALLPVGAWAIWRRKELVPLGFGVAFLFLLGLGGLTLFPKIVFGDFWKVLTYERFAFWAGVLSLFPVSAGLSVLPQKAWFKLLVALVLFVGVARAIDFRNREDILPKPLEHWEETEVVKFLDEHRDWRYVTFGLGEPQFVRLSRLTKAETVDGFFYQARWNKIEANSGSGSIDSSPWLVEKSYPLLFPMLQNPSKWNLRWAIVRHLWIKEHLINSGWKLLHPIGKDDTFRLGDPFSSLVTVWEAPGANSMPKARSSVPPYPMVFSYWWGIAPLAVLMASLGITFLSLKEEKESRTKN